MLMVYDGEKPVACGSFKEYNRGTAEIKRIWVSPGYRGRHISKEIMARLEGKARELGYRRLILQTREACMEAVALYEATGYEKIPNYPPYHEMQLAVCYAKEIAPSCPCEGQDGRLKNKLDSLFFNRQFEALTWRISMTNDNPGARESESGSYTLR